MFTTHKIIIKRITLSSIYLLFGLIFLIAYTGGISKYFSFLNYVPGGDKTGHLVGLFVLALSTSWLFNFKKLGKFYTGAVIVAILITIEEFIQLLSPYRTFDLLDLTCNYLGIVLASVILNFTIRGKMEGGKIKKS